MRLINSLRQQYRLDPAMLVPERTELEIVYRYVRARWRNGSADNDRGKAGSAGNDRGKAGSTGNDSGKAGSTGNDSGKAGSAGNERKKAGSTGNDSGKAGSAGNDSGKAGSADMSGNADTPGDGSAAASSFAIEDLHELSSLMSAKLGIRMNYFKLKKVFEIFSELGLLALESMDAGSLIVKPVDGADRVELEASAIYKQLQAIRRVFSNEASQNI